MLYLLRVVGVLGVDACWCERHLVLDMDGVFAEFVGSRALCKCRDFAQCRV